jgi:predicted PurR-regulated permease PerM
LDIRATHRRWRFGSGEPATAPADPAAAPPAELDRLWQRATQAAVIGLFVLVLLGVVKLMGEVLVPVMAALVMGSIIGRWVDRLAKLHIHPAVSAFILIAALGAGSYLLFLEAVGPLGDWVKDAPAMAERLTKRVAVLLEPLASLKKLTAPAQEPTVPGTSTTVVVQQESGWTSAVLAHVTPALAQTLIFFGTLIFFVIGRNALKRKLVLAFGDREQRIVALKILNNIEEALGRYFGTAVIVYAGVGVATGFVAWFGGLPGAILWGVITFFASFVPYIGAAAIVGCLALAGLVAHDNLSVAFLPALAFLAIHLVTENALVPTVLGKRMNLNPFVVFMAIAFWTWMWGPVGAIMAVPMLLVGIIVYDQLFEEVRTTLPE